MRRDDSGNRDSALSEVFVRVKRPWLIRSSLAVLVVSAVGMSLALQGWKSRILTFDLLPNAYDAAAFLQDGRVPTRGTLTSLGSYAPPGTTWLIVPGVLLFDDPRVYQYVGSGALYVGTLLGLFGLAHRHFGMRTAILAVTLYALSSLGLFFAASLWPRGHAFFCVWTVYCTDLWVRSRNPNYFIAAVVTWAAGMYVFMEIAPLLCVLPIVWLLYRAPLPLRSLLIAGIFALVIWYPYLQFEFARGFADLRSQVVRQGLLPANYKVTWCDSSLALRQWDEQRGTRVSGPDQVAGFPGQPSNKLRNWVRAIGAAVYTMIRAPLSNFEQGALLPGVGVVLLLVTVGTLVLLGISACSHKVVDLLIYWRYWGNLITVFALGMIVSGTLANEFLVARYLTSDGVLEVSTRRVIRGLQAAFVVAGTALLARRRIVALIKGAVGSPGTLLRSRLRPENVGVLVLGLVVPWLILLLIVEPGRWERFWWLWPLQVVFVAASVTYIPSLLSVPAVVRWIGQALLILMVLGNNSLLSKLDGWVRSGWSGPDADQVQVVDYVATELKLQHRQQTAIGYQTLVFPFMASFNVVDPRYKVGAEFDALFEYRHGIENTNGCAEGVSPVDEYRIVQTRPTGNARHYFVLPPEEGWQVLGQVGPYEVLGHN